MIRMIACKAESFSGIICMYICMCQIQYSSLLSRLSSKLDLSNPKKKKKLFPHKYLSRGKRKKSKLQALTGRPARGVCNGSYGVWGGKGSTVNIRTFISYEDRHLYVHRYLCLKKHINALCIAKPLDLFQIIWKREKKKTTLSNNTACPPKIK